MSPARAASSSICTISGSGGGTSGTLPALVTLSALGPLSARVLPPPPGRRTPCAAFPSSRLLSLSRGAPRSDGAAPSVDGSAPEASTRLTGAATQGGGARNEGGRRTQESRVRRVSPPPIARSISAMPRRKRTVGPALPAPRRRMAQPPDEGGRQVALPTAPWCRARKLLAARPSRQVACSDASIVFELRAERIY